MKKFIILILAALLPVVATATDTAPVSPQLTKKEQRRTLRGYKGFVEVASLTSFELFGDDYLLGEFTTSHGYQANNFFYLGGGTGVHIYSQYGALVPFFANLRINILNKKITPIIDCKVGYSVGRFYGTYFSGTIGLRFSLGGKKAVYALGELLSIQMDDRCDDGYGKIGIRVGYEF